MNKKMIFILIFFPFTLPLGSVSPSQENKRIALLQRFEETGEYEVEVGDLIEIAFPGDAQKGPINLEVTIKSEKKLFSAEAKIVLVVPPPPDPEDPKRTSARPEIRAYLTAEHAGLATIVVTPILLQQGQKGMPRTFRTIIK